MKNVIESQEEEEEKILEEKEIAENQNLLLPKPHSSYSPLLP